MEWLDSVVSEGQHALRLQSDLEYFAKHALQIRPKDGRP